MATKQTPSKRKASKAAPSKKKARPRAPGKGRPIAYSPALAAKVCSMLMGEHPHCPRGKPMSLLAITKLPDMPQYSTIYDWLGQHPAFADNYARARDVQIDKGAEAIPELAATAKDAALARVQIDANKWYYGRMRPKKWGDHVQVSHGGTPDAPPIPVAQTIEHTGMVKLEASDAYLKLITGSKR